MTESSTTTPPGQQQNKGRVQVLIVDDHPVIRDAVTAAIGRTMDLDVCGNASTAGDAIFQVEQLRPDVAIIDLSLEDAHGLDLVQIIRSQHPKVKMVVFSIYNEDIYAERAVRAGASGYLMKTAPTKRLIEAIRSASRGEVYLSRRMASQIFGKVAMGRSSEPSFPIDELTNREMTVFQMLGVGYDIEDIAHHFNLNRKTVETYRRRAKEKLGFETVLELLQHAVQWTYGQRSQSRAAWPPKPLKKRHRAKEPSMAG